MNKKILRFLVSCIFALISFASFAQDSSRLRISLLTCTPGEELYATFGHSALRVIDSNSVTDIVYNYGTFNFDDDYFLLKFIRGKLKYYVSTEQFQDFKFAYIQDNRGITEQVLNFTGAEKTNIYHALLENLKEENKFYLYDFFLDNCTTRLRDIIVKNHQPAPKLPAVMPVTYTFRNAIHQYLDKNHKDWSKLGIDILLGEPCDGVMTPAQQEFLPDNLMKALDSTKNVQLVSSSQDLYQLSEQKAVSSFFTPFVCSVMLFALFAVLAVFRNTTVRRLLHSLDAFLFFVIGLLGIVLVLMWVATDHSMTKNNYNLLWAWPVHIVYAFVMNKDSKRVRIYSLFVSVFLLLLLCSWHFLAQNLNNALIPVVLLMSWRSGAKLVKDRGSVEKGQMTVDG